MAQFSLRRLLASTALIAAGCGLLVLVFSHPHGAKYPVIPLKGYLYFGSGALIGVGLFNLIKKPHWGVFIGILLALIALNLM